MAPQRHQCTQPIAAGAAGKGCLAAPRRAQPRAARLDACKCRFDTSYRTRAGVWKYVDFKKVAVITNENLEESCRQQGVAVEASRLGTKGKLHSYRKSISNLDKLQQGWPRPLCLLHY